MHILNKQLGITLAMLGAIIFVVCFFWGFVIAPDVRELHADLLKISVLGWTGMNVGSFILGIIQWTIWGWLIGITINGVNGLFTKGSSGKKGSGSCCK